MNAGNGNFQGSWRWFVKLAELFGVQAEFACDLELVHVRVDGACGRRSRSGACQMFVRAT